MKALIEYKYETILYRFQSIRWNEFDFGEKWKSDSDMEVFRLKILNQKWIILWYMFWRYKIIDLNTIVKNDFPLILKLLFETIIYDD